jgi:hypothetical protein
MCAIWSGQSELAGNGIEGLSLRSEIELPHWNPRLLPMNDYGAHSARGCDILSLRLIPRLCCAVPQVELLI